MTIGEIKLNYDKRNFVNRYLSSAIVRIREDVQYCEYVQEKNQEEYVLIVYSNGYVKRICVSGGSNLCIMYDVSKYLLNH